MEIKREIRQSKELCVLSAIMIGVSSAAYLVVEGYDKWLWLGCVAGLCIVYGYHLLIVATGEHE